MRQVSQKRAVPIRPASKATSLDELFRSLIDKSDPSLQAEVRRLEAEFREGMGTEIPEDVRSARMTW